MAQRFCEARGPAPLSPLALGCLSPSPQPGIEADHDIGDEPREKIGKSAMICPLERRQDGRVAS
jgi:hypothetical protein